MGDFIILNVPWVNWNSYLEGGGLQGEEIVKSTLFCKVHYVLYSDIKIQQASFKVNFFLLVILTFFRVFQNTRKVFKQIFRPRCKCLSVFGEYVESI
jgi:hypothetical protein